MIIFLQKTSGSKSYRKYINIGIYGDIDSNKPEKVKNCVKNWVYYES